MKEVVVLKYHENYDSDQASFSVISSMNSSWYEIVDEDIPALKQGMKLEQERLNKGNSGYMYYTLVERTKDTDIDILLAKGKAHQEEVANRQRLAEQEKTRKALERLAKDKSKREEMYKQLAKEFGTPSETPVNTTS